MLRHVPQIGACEQLALGDTAVPLLALFSAMPRLRTLSCQIGAALEAEEPSRALLCQLPEDQREKLQGLGPGGKALCALQSLQELEQLQLVLDTRSLPAIVFPPRLRWLEVRANCGDISRLFSGGPFAQVRKLVLVSSGFEVVQINAIL
jgi:hypothetical protein